MMFLIIIITKFIIFFDEFRLELTQNTNFILKRCKIELLTKRCRVIIHAFSFRFKATRNIKE